MTMHETPRIGMAPRREASLFNRFWRWEASGILVALVVLTVALSLAADNFLSAYNVEVVVRQAAFVGLVALGQTLVLLVGGIDLSVGAAAGHLGDRRLDRADAMGPAPLARHPVHHALRLRPRRDQRRAWSRGCGSIPSSSRWRPGRSSPA